MGATQLGAQPCRARLALKGAKVTSSTKTLCALAKAKMSPGITVADAGNVTTKPLLSAMQLALAPISAVLVESNRRLHWNWAGLAAAFRVNKMLFASSCKVALVADRDDETHTPDEAHGDVVMVKFAHATVKHRDG